MMDFVDSQTEDKHDPNTVSEKSVVEEDESFYSMAPSKAGSTDNSVVEAATNSTQESEANSEASDEPGFHRQVVA